MNFDPGALYYANTNQLNENFVDMDINENTIKKILAGDKKLLTKLVQFYQAKVIAIVTPIVGHDNASDVVQEAWISVIKKIDQFKGNASFTTWLYRVFINQAKMFLRQPQFQAMHDTEIKMTGYFNKKGQWLVPPLNWHVESPHTLLHLVEFEKELYSFISTLPTLQALILLMHDVEQIKFSEICNILEISASNGRVLLHRARKALYQHIDSILETKQRT